MIVVGLILTFGGSTFFGWLFIQGLTERREVVSRQIGIMRGEGSEKFWMRQIFYGTKCLILLAGGVAFFGGLNSLRVRLKTILGISRPCEASGKEPDVGEEEPGG